MSAIDAIMNGSRALASSSKPKKRQNGSGSDTPAKKKALSHEHVNINVDVLKSKIEKLKSEPANFKVDSFASCISGAERKQITETPFVFICLALELISEEAKRNIIANIACNMLRVVMSSCCSEKDLITVLRLLSYKVAPVLEGGSDQLGIGRQALVKAIADAYGATKQVIEDRLKDLGDLGIVAQKTRSTQPMLFNFKPKALTVTGVYHSFQKIARISGKNSEDEKLKIVKQLLSASSCEYQRKYLIRLMLPEEGLRVGLTETTLLGALGRAAIFLGKDKGLSLKDAAAIVRKAYAVVPVYETIVQTLFNTGIRTLLKSYGPSVGIAMEPMLCEAIGSVKDALKFFGNSPTICEYKYDGERAQIHFMEDGGVEIFSRKLECMTGKYPDVVDTVKRLKRASVTSFIMDCEIVGCDRVSEKPSSFQKLMTRARKDVDINKIKINVCIFAFDMLYLNSQSLIEEQLGVRRTHLLSSFDEEAGYFQFVTALSSKDPKSLQVFLEESVAASCEGLVFKSTGVNSKYEPGKRNWLKLKKDFITSMWDSFDLVPIGASYGNGNRAGVYGTFLLACYDPSTEEFQTHFLCTGFSDKLLDDFHKSFQSKVITSPKPNYIYNADSVKPDVWFEPSEVWEVKAGGLTISPVHSAATGLVDSTKGLSLRNPTLHRVREDKVPEMATTAKQVAEMYSRQWKMLKCSTSGEVDEVG